MTLDETRMEEFLLITYILVLISLAIIAWLWIEVDDLKQKLWREINRRKTNITKPQTKVRPKGFWD
jgi:hypothetical protein